MPLSFDDVAECVENTLSRVGSHIVLALPLGIGKPNPLVNEFYRRARRDPAIALKIFTALSLRAPQWNGELERLFLQPMVERLFAGVSTDSLELGAEIAGAAIVLASGFAWRRMHPAAEAAKG